MSTKNKIVFLILLIVTLLLLTSCNAMSVEPIRAETPGIWNHYFVYPLSWLLIYSAEHMAGSYGLAIILVTLMIRFILLPLTIKQMKSTRAMQMLKPELDKLQNRKDLKKDQQKYQQEMLSLYQRHGVNPLAGCLPIFIQLPIMLAFYYAIMRTEEIARTTFLWFDLGNPDPIFLLPILAAITTYLSTKISMTNLTAQTKVILYIMPMMILVAALAMPSALALYWVVGNIFVMAQSYFLIVRTKPLEIQTEIKS